MTYKKHLREEDIRTALPDQTGNEDKLLQTTGTNLAWSSVVFNILAIDSSGSEQNIAVTSNSNILVYTADGVEHYLKVTS